MSVAVYRWFGLRPGEVGKTAGMFLYMLTAVGAFITGRIARDAIFLSRYDVDYLPYMYVWVAGAMVVCSYVYSHFADRFRRDRLVLTVTALLLVLMLGARAMLSLCGEWFYPVLYVFVEVMGGLLLIQFWTFADDVFNTREAKRLFGLVGSGGVAAAVVFGSIVGVLAQSIGTGNLLFISAGLLAACLVVVSVLSRSLHGRFAGSNAGPGKKGAISLSADWGKVFSSRHLKVIAWLVMLTFVAVTIVDYQFKIISRFTYLNREVDLARYFGIFYAVSGILCLLIQILFTGRLMQRAGIVASLLLLPAWLAVGSMLLFVAPVLWAVTLLKGADNVLRYSINDAATQVLFLPIPARIRGRAKTFIDGILKPLAQGGTGLVIAWTAALVGYRAAWLSLGSLAVLCVWTIIVLGMKNEYVRTLLSTLRQRKLHFGESSPAIPDAQAVEALRQTLTDRNENTVLHALEMLPFVRRHDWSPELGPLLNHASPRVRLQAIRLLEKEDGQTQLDGVLARFHDPDKTVRAEAVLSYCAAMKEKALPIVEPLLRDESIEVKAAAVVGLIGSAGLDGIVIAAEVLRDLVGSDDPDVRRAGAWAIGKVGIRSLYGRLLILLADPEPLVRVAAVRAAGVLGCQELMLPLIYSLADPHTTRAAIGALGAYGASLITTLRTVLDNPQEDPAIRQAIPQILARIGGQMSMDVLSNILQADETYLRSRALEAILQLHLGQTDLRRDREMLRRALHMELKNSFQLHATLTDLAPLGHDLLMENFRHRIEQTLDRVFKLLRILHPGKHLDTVQRNVASPDPAIRSNSVELLDNILDAGTRRCLMALLDEHDTGTISALGSELFPLLHMMAENWLQELARSDHAWTAACALDAIGRLGNARFVPLARMLLAHASPLVRQTAAFSLKKLPVPGGCQKDLSRLVEDPSPKVREAARFLLASAGFFSCG
ncbi:MAG TPA: Npt1/Npt2 family nucleotide transporter [Myxococcota bacterium]|nr:Npt1/Npt2 family nucleotide transporter [Myxococcota bacterium]